MNSALARPGQQSSLLAGGFLASRRSSLRSWNDLPSTIALALALIGIAMLPPPPAQRTLASLLPIALTGVAIGRAVLRYCVIQGIAARRMERSTGGWVGLAVLLFPIGRLAALVLLSWFAHERAAP